MHGCITILQCSKNKGCNLKLIDSGALHEQITYVDFLTDALELWDLSWLFALSVYGLTVTL